ncbi:hypothetical protein [Fimbriiglobus ruber]|uniref:Uncharacterized protein n=1 Tax=Fimbriiglobus ruber TaxID=1908690 RepID=A0A225DY97_9BACT|nr:hypothetical protein [Fimbriiglobus ruber]OWK46341.1 hypothetical protein FRUB_00040 [Fimbriiglobus ruber]
MVGATDDKQFLVPLDPKTLKTDVKAGIRVRPEHVHAALRSFAGIDNHPFAKQFPFEIPIAEQIKGLWG